MENNTSIGKQFKHGVKTLFKVDTGLNSSSKLLFVLLVLVSMSSTASAIDLNSTTELRYFPGTNLEFQVGTTGNIDAYGQLNLNNNALTGVGSLDCSSGQVLFGDGSCGSPGVATETLAETLTAGNTADQTIDMGGNTINNIGKLNATTSSGTRIADFTSNQIKLHQPLSVESSGPMSVQNGIDLTGTDTNTIESYSTMYLTTSSGSPTDIVIRPEGLVDIDSNVALRGNLDMKLNDINSVGSGGLGHVDIGTGYNSDPGLTIDDTGDGKKGHLQLAGGGNIVFRDDTGSNVITMPNDGTQDVEIPNGNLDVSGTTDGVDLDATGNAITIDGSNRYAVSEGSISHDNIAGVSSGDHHTKTTDTNTQLDDEAATSNVNINNNQLNSVNQLNFNGGAYLDEGTADYGSLRLDGGESSSWGGINVQGNRDVVVGMTDADGSGFSTGAYDDDNNNWIWHYDGSRTELRYNGNWRLETESYGVNVNTGGSNSDGYRLDGSAAITTDGNWLRLNQQSNWNDRIYTPSKMRADGGFSVNGNQIIQGDGEVTASQGMRLPTGQNAWG